METLSNIKLVVEYDGSQYAGWQRQVGQMSVQQRLEEAVLLVTGNTVPVIGASRTDAGVHAAGQTANVRLVTRIPAERFAYALNNRLPPDIRVKSSQAVPLDFHAQYNARRKQYTYQVYQHPQGSALLLNRCWMVRETLDVQAMQQCATLFIGAHDFSAFRAAGGQAKTTRRELYRSQWEAHPQGEGLLLTYTVEGNGFLYNMVRIMVGTMVAVGRGKMNAADIDALMAAKDRRRMGQTAPPQGLCLQRIWYNGDVE